MVSKWEKETRVNKQTDGQAGLSPRRQRLHSIAAVTSSESSAGISAAPLNTSQGNERVPPDKCQGARRGWSDSRWKRRAKKQKGDCWQEEGVKGMCEEEEESNSATSQPHKLTMKGVTGGTLKWIQTIKWTKFVNQKSWTKKKKNLKNNIYSMQNYIQTHFLSTTYLSWVVGAGAFLWPLWAWDRYNQDN